MKKIYFLFLPFCVLSYFFLLPISHPIMEIYVTMVKNYDLVVPPSFQTRSDQLTFTIGQLRSEILAEITKNSSRYELESIFMENLKESKSLRQNTSLRNIYIPWVEGSNPAQGNLLRQEYYDLVADENICSKIRTKAPFSYQNYYNFTCETDPKFVFVPREFDSSKMINDFDDTVEGEKYSVTGSEVTKDMKKVRVMSICSPCLVSGLGKISVEGYRPKLDDCMPHNKEFSRSHLVDNYDEVFVTSQYWGNFYFHKMVEDIPRLALFLPFLQSQPSIKIHAMDNSQRTQQIFTTLGLDPSRIVSGHVIAKVAYVPRATSCGNSNFLESQVLNQVYRDYIRKHIGQPIRNKLVIVKRTGIRNLMQHNEIVSALNSTAANHSLELQVFNDNPLPPFNETMLLFSEAVAILAPHGAGLSNMFFSSPGTLVVEGNLKDEFNLCYQRLAYSLGMRYYVMSSESGSTGVVSLNVTIVQNTMDELLKMMLGAKKGNELLQPPLNMGTSTRTPQDN